MGAILPQHGFKFCFRSPTNEMNRNPIDTVPIEDSFSPVLHRTSAAIRSRAIHPNEPIPPPSSTLLKFSLPAEDLVEKSKKYLDRLIAEADVKKGLFLLFVPSPTIPSLTRP